MKGSIELKTASSTTEEKESDDDLLKIRHVRIKRFLWIVTYNADRLNSLETGIGYGTDTGTFT